MLYDLLLGTAEAVKNDESLQTFCESEFGKRITLFVGVDEKNLPGEDQFPLLILGGNGVPLDIGENQTDWGPGVSMEMWFLKESAAVNVDGIQVMPGVPIGEKIAEHLHRIIRKTWGEDWIIDRLLSDIDSDIIHPEYCVVVAFRLSAQKTFSENQSFFNHVPQFRETKQTNPTGGYDG